MLPSSNLPTPAVLEIEQLVPAPVREPATSFD
jgi:hypothetical protein